MDRRSVTICTIIAGAAASLLIGCETMNPAHWLRDLAEPRAAEADLERHREKFIVDRDPASFRWLVSHAVENGMTPVEVDRVIGDTGERIDRDQALKSERGEYLQTDVAYKWGPDADGRSVVLFFRDGHLVNYDAKQFAAMDVPDRL